MGGSKTQQISTSKKWDKERKGKEMIRLFLRNRAIQSHQIRFFSTAEEASKAARKLRAATGASNQSNQGKQKASSNSNIYLYGFLGTVLLGAGYATYDITENKDGFLGHLYYGSPVDKLVQAIHHMFYGQLLVPQTDKLVPDFVSGPSYGELPPGAQPPPLLVLDLERTLIGSIYDGQHGWRHVKRPGLDKFFEQVTPYFEIVIFSENDKGVSQDIMDTLHTQSHKFGSSEAEIRGDLVIKRLDLMNRPMRKIILIDDDPLSAENYPKNTLLIKPYRNIYDTSDNALVELIPFLQALVHEGIEDIPAVIEGMGTNDAHEIALEYKKRVVAKKTLDYQRKHRGLGSLVRQAAGIEPGREKGPGEDGHAIDDSNSTRILTPAEIVGQAPVAQPAPLTRPPSPLNGQPAPSTSQPPAEKRKGALFAWYEQAEQKKLAEENKRNEAYHREHEKRMEAKRAAERQREIDQENDRMRRELGGVRQ